ncbi:hypothetical protein LRX75_07600 [Rhizobium sp. DKSPLA3]|uniref:Uncharacterized protein n=1 Tax=Rhizobium quercicola TaxID=2901226 RepID=A0A9X1NTA9_9HYPH|nr:hypothetical protein [Rhizobium quercicola]MCD7108903.1 hypothetical protein [Rhizobium quercicola]
MNAELEKLIEKARKIVPTEAHLEEQRRSFAYGSAKIENSDITREMIDQAAMRLRQEAHGK